MSAKRCISFDVFDTVLLRPFAKPTDLFGYIESLSDQYGGFADARVGAERSCRTGDSDITLDQIYLAIPQRYRDLKESEIRTEISLSVANQEICGRMKAYREQGCTIVLISDMYLPKEVISAMLEHVGVDCYDHLFVSSETGDSKHNGRIFGRVADELGIRPEDMLHIGDDHHSDVNMPHRSGMEAEQYVPPMRKELESRHVRPYLRKRTPGRSMITAMDSFGCDSDDEWYRLGYRFGGPLMLAYTEFLAGNADKDSLMLFASRDGYPIMKVLEKTHPEFRNKEYVYVQRIMSAALADGSAPYGKISPPSKIVSPFLYARAKGSAECILYFLRDELDVPEFGSVDEMFGFYNSHSDEIDALRRERRESYSAYLSDICEGHDSVELVDSTTMRFTSQRVVEGMIGRPVTGNYLITMGESPLLKYRTFCARHSPVMGWKRINIPEFFICSPELPIRSWDGGPTYDDVCPLSEKERAENCQSMCEGMCDYASYTKELFGDDIPKMDYDDVMQWSLLSYRDFGFPQIMKRMMWAGSPDHSDWHNLVPRASDVPYNLSRMAKGALGRMHDAIYPRA